LWNAKLLSCGSPRGDVASSIKWAAPEIKIDGPTASKKTPEEESNGQLIMIIVVIVGFFVLAGLAFMYVRRRKPTTSTPGAEEPIALANAYEEEEGADVIEVMDNAPVRNNDTGTIIYSYGDNDSIDLDDMDDETAFNEYGALPVSSGAMDEEPWNCGDISRKTAEQMLAGAPAGGFLIRSKKEGGDVITMAMPRGAAKPFRNYQVTVQTGNNSSPPVYIIADTRVGEYSSLGAFVAALQRTTAEPLPGPLKVVPLRKPQGAAKAARPPMAWNVGNFDELDF
jgi:hypothetical protein